MLVPDVNVLLYAYDSSAAHHTTARAWLESTLGDARALGLPPVSLLGFLRLATNPRVYENPMPVGEALDAVDTWLSFPQVVLLEPGPRHLDVLRSLLEPLGSGGNLVTDAHLAALAIEHGADLVSYDSDFARFPGLRWTSPAEPG